MRYKEYAPDEIHHHDHLDTHLVKVLRTLYAAKQADSDYYGWVGAAVMDPDHNIVFGINHQDGEGKRYHAERVAVIKYLKKYGPIPPGSIVLTTCSPCNEQMDERHGESCTVFLNRAGVKKVYCGYLDPSQTSDEPRNFSLEETRNTKIRELCKKIASNFLDLGSHSVTEDEVKIDSKAKALALRKWNCHEDISVTEWGRQSAVTQPEFSPGDRAIYGKDGVMVQIVKKFQNPWGATGKFQMDEYTVKFPDGHEAEVPVHMLKKSASSAEPIRRNLRPSLSRGQVRTPELAEHNMHRLMNVYLAEMQAAGYDLTGY